MMDYLAENSLPIWMGGAIAFTMALVAYLQTRGNAALLSIAAAVRKDVETLMPLVKIERARVMGTPQIDVDPNFATVKCRGLIIATNNQNGMKGGAEDELTLTFALHNDRWLLQDYSSQRNWQRALGR